MRPTSVYVGRDLSMGWATDTDDASSYDPFAYTFAISAALGGLAGGFYAGYLQNLHPDSFKFLESVWVLCMVVIGGMGSITGALLGAVIFVTVRELLRDVLGRIDLPAESLYLLFGTALVLIMRFRPDGLISTKTLRANLHAAPTDPTP